MNLSKKSFAFVAVSLLLAVMRSGCINLEPPPDADTSGLTLKLTDPTRTDLVSVLVTITKIEVYAVGAGDEEGIVVYEDEDGLEVDLLDIQLPEMVTVVENINLEPGNYDHFKLYLKEFVVEDTTYHAWATEDGGEPFPCRVPPGKFNVEVWAPENGENTFLTKEEGVQITVIIDFRWNGNVSRSP